MNGGTNCSNGSGATATVTTCALGVRAIMLVAENELLAGSTNDEVKVNL